MVLPQNIAAVLAGSWQLLNSTPTYLNGTKVPPGDLGDNEVGLLIYDANGYMSANMASTEPEHQVPNKENLTDFDYSMIGRHTLSYAGELHVWNGSNETAGTLTHGPLTMATRPRWLSRNQTRNYIVSKAAFEGKDVLHLWLRDEKEGKIANIFWARAG
ncbi:Lipocalin-like domain-containing protein [Pyrenochaeta sp. MPI-SDFR-AT-0127]|nr:Lipocalin-like domain-containing protein [Pyrenochaeta sp. MPI-SDFR-AT-0127]